jgi:hypothetical protein
MLRIVQLVITENSIRVTLLMCSLRGSVPRKEWGLCDASQSANTPGKIYVAKSILS